MNLLRRTPCERVTAALIWTGLVLLCQPLSATAYSYSFGVLLLGVIGFSVAGKLKD
jgi:hypothetical protein